MWIGVLVFCRGEFCSDGILIGEKGGAVISSSSSSIPLSISVTSGGVEYPVGNSSLENS